MAIVRVINGVYLETDCVGKIESESHEDRFTRTKKTKIFDVAGKHILFERVTVVGIASDNTDPVEVECDDHIHREILFAIREKRDAVDFVKP